MGAMREALRRVTIEKLGEEGWRRQRKAVEEMWVAIEKAIEAIPFSYEKVRLYQDGLPVCGRESQIVKELAEVGSRNHRLLLRLMKKGATIMGTESSELLVEEYELVKQMLAAPNARKMVSAGSLPRALGDALLKKRDRFIADRINATLEGGETGILFLGMLHLLRGLLSKEIRVIYPCIKPVHHGGRTIVWNERSGSDCGRRERYPDGSFSSYGKGRASNRTG
jgi:hypothetical protein